LIIAASGVMGPDQPALRRAQALAQDGAAGLAVAKLLLGEKLAG
jgi:CRISPR associated protein Cas1